MPLFSDPMEPPSLRQAGKQVLRHAASLLAMMGWATLALGLAQHGSELWWLSLPGLFAALFAVRFPRASGVLEVVLLSAGLALLPEVAASWGITAAVLVMVGRALAVAFVLRARMG